MSRSIKTLLVANRGEIAVRIMRTCRDLGIRTVAVYSDSDSNALHVCKADEAYRLPGSRVSETYLDQARILEIAREASVDAIHPGYGFLSENASFAEAVSSAGLTFVGPPAGSISLLGDKTAARTLARELGIPTIPGSPAAHKEEHEALSFAMDAGFPVILKAAAGGGGKGMRIVKSDSEFVRAFKLAASEAHNAFGDSRVYVEKYLAAPHHVEIQILADQEGNAIWLGERDCSVQRRHQKIIEESPSPFIEEDLRKEMGEVAVRLIKAAGYVNAGTVEFLVDHDRNYFFLEVNTRLQVEHPVTEIVTGLDLVREQLSIAGGNTLSLRQNQVQFRGHAIECRVYAEDSYNDFFPSTGILETYREPSGPRVRVDSGAQPGDRVEIHYDPLLAKLVTWGSTRDEAIRTMRRALTEYAVGGVHTTIPFCHYLLGHESFIEGEQTTQLINKEFMSRYMMSNIGSADDQIAVAVSAVLLFERSNSELKGFGGALANGSRWRTRRLDTYR